LVKLEEFDKKVGDFELKIKYMFNNIVNTLNYNFKILPYITYNNNSINLIYKQSFSSEQPTVFPLDGIFSLHNNYKFISINEKSGIIEIKSGLNVGIYDIIVKYEVNKLINNTNYKIIIKPTFNVNTLSSVYQHNPFLNNYHELEPLIVNPKGGTFITDIFSIENNGVIKIPSNLDVNDYTITVKYNYLGIENEFQYLLKVVPYTLNCIFKQKGKIYDGTTNVNLIYKSPLNLNITFDSNFEDKNVGSKKILIKNIKINNSNNIIHNDTEIIGFIKPLKLDITFLALDKVYDGNNIAEITYKINNIENDDIFIESYNSYFENINVGTHKVFIHIIFI
jgi:hypothetical protein